jgi:hypothetical protein
MRTSWDVRFVLAAEEKEDMFMAELRKVECPRRNKIKGVGIDLKGSNKDILVLDDLETVKNMI